MRTSWSHLAALLRPRGPSVPANPQLASGNPNPGYETDPTTIYLADLLTDTREELTRADSKAALLLAATGVAVGALLAGFLGGKWTPFDLDHRVEWLWWVGVGSSAAGIFSIAAAVYPRIGRRGAPHPEVPAYYGDVAECKDIEMFREAIAQAPSPQKRLIDQTFQVSRIVQRKYVLLRRGLRCLFLAILACVTAVLINIPLTR